MIEVFPHPGVPVRMYRFIRDLALVIVVVPFLYGRLGWRRTRRLRTRTAVARHRGRFGKFGEVRRVRKFCRALLLRRSWLRRAWLPSWRRRRARSSRV